MIWTTVRRDHLVGWESRLGNHAMISTGEALIFQEGSNQHWNTYETLCASYPIPNNTISSFMSKVWLFLEINAPARRVQEHHLPGMNVNDAKNPYDVLKKKGLHSIMLHRISPRKPVTLLCHVLQQDTTPSSWSSRRQKRISWTPCFSLLDNNFQGNAGVISAPSWPVFVFSKSPIPYYYIMVIQKSLKN